MKKIIPIIGSVLVMAIFDRLSKSPCLNCKKKDPKLKYIVDPCSICEIKKGRIIR